MAKILYIILGTILTILITSTIVLYILYKRRWPVKFSLQSLNQDGVVNIYANDMIAFPNQTLRSGVVTEFVIDNNVHNLRTNQPITREQLTNIVVNLPQPGTIVFSAINLPKHTVILSNDQAGYSVISSNVTGNWTQVGYYTILFPNGIPLF